MTEEEDNRDEDLEEDAAVANVIKYLSNQIFF